MKRICILLASVLMLDCMLSRAEIKLPSVIADNMVLQQNSNATLWGWAKANSKVTVKASWSKSKVTVTSNNDGQWSASIATPSAGGPYSISISDGQAVTLNDILIGEVWFCSGQSNMDMPVKGYVSQPVKGSETTIMDAKESTPIRMFNVKRKASLKELDDCTGSWSKNNPEGVANCSATAYYFAQQLQKSLDVPIGIIVAAFGGTRIELWMNRSTIENKFASEFDLSPLDGNQVPRNVNSCACLLYNGMVAPVKNYTIKGWIWYQGESNREDPEQYTRLHASYAHMMREVWNNPDMPFYFVQIAPYGGYGWRTPEAAPRIMEAQQKSLALIPHSGMATTADCGEKDCIHPSAKPLVGRRLAMLALKHDYNFKGFNADCPTVKDVVEVDGEMTLRFDGVSDLGLSPINVEIPGFEVAGSDKVFYPAKVKLAKDRKSLIIKCDQVKEIASVRYLWNNYMGNGTLYDGFVAVGPFRTDDWPAVTLK